MSETWLPIPGYEGRYDVSDQGRVRSWLPWNGLPVPRVLATYGRRYPRVTLWPGRPQHVHAIVAEAFLGPRPIGLDVRHLNGDKTDNRVSNLAYGTRSENMLDDVLAGRYHQQLKRTCPQGHEYDRVSPGRFGRPRRRCRTCQREAERRYRASLRERHLTQQAVTASLPARRRRAS